jgi:hypothetical protein
MLDMDIQGIYFIYFGGYFTTLLLPGLYIVGG